MSTKMAEDPSSENAKKQLEENKKASDQSRAAFSEQTKGKPTPTQEENDLAALGAHIIEHEDDGSGPDPNVQANKTVEADRHPSRPQSYQTRHTKAE